MLCPQLDAIVWTDVCKMKVWAKRVRLPSTSELDEGEEELGEEGEEKFGRRRRRRRRRKGWGFFKAISNSIAKVARKAKQLTTGRRRRTRGNWKNQKKVQLCPFQLCPAMEHSTQKVCWQISEPHCSKGLQFVELNYC